jgi:periplasmic divalent cation tolerance protein
MSAQLVYVTAGNRDDAMKIGEIAVRERLAACANILGETTSIYWWEGDIQNEGEVAIILKTTEENLPALIDKIRGIHPYDCPCIVALPINDGNLDFLNWIENETR